MKIICKILMFVLSLLLTQGVWSKDLVLLEATRGCNDDVSCLNIRNKTFNQTLNQIKPNLAENAVVLILGKSNDKSTFAKYQQELKQCISYTLTSQDDVGKIIKISQKDNTKDFQCFKISKQSVKSYRDIENLLDGEGSSSSFTFLPDANLAAKKLHPETQNIIHLAMSHAPELQDAMVVNVYLIADGFFSDTEKETQSIQPNKPLNITHSELLSVATTDPKANSLALWQIQRSNDSQNLPISEIDTQDLSESENIMNTEKSNVSKVSMKKGINMEKVSLVAVAILILMGGVFVIFKHLEETDKAGNQLDTKKSPDELPHSENTSIEHENTTKDHLNTNPNEGKSLDLNDPNVNKDFDEQHTNNPNRDTSKTDNPNNPNKSKILDLNDLEVQKAMREQLLKELQNDSDGKS